MEEEAFLFLARIKRFTIGTMVSEVQRLGGKVSYDKDLKPETAELTFDDGSTFKAVCRHVGDWGWFNGQAEGTSNGYCSRAS